MAKPKAAPPLPPVTPEIAQEVWDSLAEPSKRTVADRLNASGKYQPVSEASVGRWKRAGWKLKTANPSRYRKKNAREKLDTVAVVTTGNPVADVGQVIGDHQAEFEALTAFSAAELQDKAHRDRWAAFIVSQRLAMAKIATDPEATASTVGTLERALSGALLEMATAQKTYAEAQGKVAPPPDGEGAKVIEHNEFDTIRDAWRKAAAAA